MKKTLGAIALALVSGLLTSAPVEAHTPDPGDHVLGHRCRTYDAAVTNENTVLALSDTAGVPGAICEIDAVRISDGTVIIWHDGTWNRVANHSTLPAGVSPSSAVTSATWSQVSQIRTKGGQPVPRLEDMIAAAARYNIALAVDLRNAVPATQAATFVRQATSLGADVRYYQLLRASCSTTVISRFRNAGARVGVKILGDCPMTAQQMRSVGATFTQQLSFRLTDAFLDEADALGIEVGVLDRGMTEATAQTLIARGVDRVLLDRPRDALGWDI
jgi:glycerophosphoryl diester phosphodiesterase